MTLTTRIEEAIHTQPGICVNGIRAIVGCRSSDVFSTIKSLERQGRVRVSGKKFYPPKSLATPLLQIPWGPLPSKHSRRIYQQRKLKGQFC